MYALNPVIETVTPSPVAEAQGWVRGRQFPADKPLLDVAQAVPGYPPAEELRQHLATLAVQPGTAFYTPIFGIPELREALTGHMNQSYQASIDSEQVAIIAGCNQGFCATITALAKPGDEVILPLPYYFNHQMWVQMSGVSAVPLPFNENGGAIPSVADAAAAITPKTKAIALVTPNNPTGAIYPPEVLDAFYRLARECGIALIVDETYKDFRETTAPAHHLFSYSDWPETLIQLYSFSKTFSLTGYRVGSVIADQRLLTEISKFQDCVAICAPRIGQEAALFGLRHLHDWCEDKRRLMKHRAQTLSESFQQHQLAYQMVSLGAYFAYVKHPFPGESAKTVAKRLIDEYNVLCLPGSTFGPGQDDYLRLAFANLDAEQMPALAERLAASQNT